jgi:hypothetical protein
MGRRAVFLALIVVGGKKYHLALRRFFQDHLLGLRRITLKHVNVRDHDFGAMLKDHPQRLSRAARFGHNFDVALIIDQAPQSLAQQYVIVHQNASNFLILMDLCVGTHRPSLPER